MDAGRAPRRAAAAPASAIAHRAQKVAGAHVPPRFGLATWTAAVVTPLRMPAAVSTRAAFATGVENGVSGGKRVAGCAECARRRPPGPAAALAPAAGVGFYMQGCPGLPNVALSFENIGNKMKS